MKFFNRIGTKVLLLLAMLSIVAAEDYDDGAYPTKDDYPSPVAYEDGVYPTKDDYPSPVAYDAGVYPTKDDYPSPVVYSAPVDAPYGDDYEDEG